MASLKTTRAKAEALLDQYGLTEKGWTFEFDRAKRRGGVCKYATKTISLSAILVPMWDDDAVEQTIIHEVAHAVVGHGAGHGQVWRLQMRRMGAPAERTHANETVPGRWVAVCPTHGAVTRRHRLTAGMRYATHSCGQMVSWTDSKLINA